MAAIKSGTGVYAPYGGFRVEFGLEDLSYTLSPYSPSTLPTAGTYTYSKTGANTATVSLPDSSGLILTSSFNLAFSSSAAADFAGGNADGSQDGVLFFETGASPSAGASGGKLVNMSVRAVIADGSRIIPGFVVEGGSAKVLIRAAGPALAGFGVEGAMINPRFSVYSGDTRIGTNTFWESDSPNRENVIDAASRVGAFPFLNGSADAAMVLILDPGPYTAILYGWDYVGGEVLLEVYRVPED